MDIVDLQSFYSEDLGKVACKMITRTIGERWPDLTGYNMLGLGFATPYMEPFKDEAAETFAFMPARQGVMRWPDAEKNCVALIDSASLPLENSSIDRILVVHGIEMSHRPRDYLREIWRVLKPDGRAIFVVPNRTGIWARADKTPFGHGRPFSQNQMLQLLKDNMFLPIGWSGALYIPPSKRDFILKSAPAFEKFGLWARAGLGGVTIIEATKQVYALPPMQGLRKKKLKNIIIHQRDCGASLRDQQDEV
ncbi:MAG: methyltransferase domain-containing protein [Alphaproteobacteria bacterium]|nr:methyltransferase domain-containing protein [Alphaproteobacteria bacterium]